MPKIFHTSDIHIGAPFVFLSGKAEQYRSIIKDSFTRLVDLCISEKVEVLLISGDLFDTNFPSDSNIAFVKEQFQKLSQAGTRVLIIAGNHDYYSEGSVYDRGIFADLPNIKIFMPPYETLIIPELNCAFYGVSNTTNKSIKHPLGYVKELEKDTFHHIALIHGSMQIVGKDSDSNLPITSEEIQKSGLSYIALGDWHGLNDFSAGNTKCFYPGSLEPIDFSQVNSGYIIEINFDDKSITAKPRKVGKIKIETVEYQFDENNDLTRLRTVLADKADPDTVLIVNLAGESISNLLEIMTELTSEFESKYFFLKISDKTRVSFDAKDLEKLTNDPIIEAFIQNVEQFAIEKDRKEFQDQAVQLGLSKLAKITK
ncbi:DNA repair exonuclease [Candidatus Dojkabacteria bacterium]|uniref:DNA repair exonuclease n=1 Tax=Candidatus Dojkabacteria bacterium TaxID=2099670 RepID=A0A955RI44_9BACT|nr:DNA repair exonuclease [Candidatus Dojkabacteria bacterium]